MAEVTNEELLRRIEELEAQMRIQNAFVSSLVKAQDWQTTMENIETVATEVTECDKAEFFCFDHKEGKFFTSTENGYRDWHTMNDASELYAVKEQASVVTDGRKAFIPIADSGILTLEKAKGFDDKDFTPFLPGGGVVNTISLAVEKEFKHQQSVTDELTQLKNRFGIDEYIEKTLCGNINASKSVFVVMCDIDHFKSVNDTYGHDAGDVVLKNVAKILQDNTRAGADCTFRLGGEEMVMILNCSAAQAYEVCDRLRQQIADSKHTVSVDGKEHNISVTLSMGLAQVAPETEMTPENSRSLFDAELKKADEFVYCAKNTGRNKIVSSPEIYDEYISQKTADVLEQNNNNAVKEEIKKCIKEDFEAVIDVLDDAEKTNPEKSDAVGKIKKGILDADKSTHKYSDNRSFGTVKYSEIEDKKYITKVSEKHIEQLKSALEDANIKYSGVQPRKGEYTITVDGWDNLKSAKKMYNEIKVCYEQDKAVKSSIIGNTEYKDIENKTYINGSTGVIKEIAKNAQEKGIEFSGKYSGKHSTLTVDGKNDDVKKFLDECKKVEEWADKISVKVAEIKKEKNRTEEKAKGETI